MIDVTKFIIMTGESCVIFSFFLSTFDTEINIQITLQFIEIENS